MATHNVRMGEVDISLIAKVKPAIAVPLVEQAPGGLFPLQSSAWETDEFRIFRGWPVPAPPVEVRAQTLVSSVGEVLGTREDPTSVSTGAAMRWVVDDAFYSTDTLQWLPVIGETPWTVEVAHAPVLIHDFGYQMGRERFTADVLNFDSDTKNFMRADFNNTLRGVDCYTVIMVVTLHSIYGTTADVPYNGLWCPCDNEGGWVSVTTQGNFIYLESDNAPRVRNLSISDQLKSTSPAFLALVLDRPTSTVYAGMGPQNIRHQRSFVGEAVAPPYLEIHLGKSGADLEHTSDMALLDLGVYPRALSATEVANEFSLLAMTYGGDK